MRTRERLDLDPESRAALEFDAVLELVAAHAASAAGAARLLACWPLADAAAVGEEQAVVAEAAEHVEQEGRLLPARLPDPEAALAGLAVVGYAVEPLALRDLATVLIVAGDLRARLAGVPEERWPRLRALGAALADLRPLARRVAGCVGPDGKLTDEASAELQRLRQATARTGEKLRRQLESFLHDPDSAAAIRDDFVTQRNGRYVIPVRTDSPRAVKGIVHAASSSGATLFVEPLESVELNNALVRLAEEEAQETERVVRGWSDRFREREGEVMAAIDGVARADTLQARALFGASMGGVRPKVAAGAPLELREVRHPLLDRRLREHGARCVPLRFELGESDRVLVLSGPNTGGKTVALKTLGLAVLMAQSGIPVLAEEAALPVFRQVRADIGDHQSIDADLSTFSAHVRATARFVEEAAPPALFLFDEIGTGTEPTEGAALAQAILERLHRSGVTTVATTHQAALKAWAFTTPGAASAAMEFDEATLQPTFRVLPGAAGASAGIDIASRLGLDEVLVGRARELLGAGSRQAEAYMARLRDLMSDAERRREELLDRERALEAERTALEERASRDAARAREDASKALQKVLAEFRDATRREIAAIQDKKERARVEREHTRAEMRLRAERAAKEREVGAGLVAAPTGPVEPRPGLAVRIVSLGREGEVVALKGDKVEVRMGSTTFTVRRSDLGAAGPAPAPEPRRPSAVAAAAAGRLAASRDDAVRDEAPPELHLLGKTVDEALEALDKFLDDAALSGRTEVRVIHGHGTGRLKAAVRRFLRSHPHAASQRPGEPREGGDGATIVTLR